MTSVAVGVAAAAGAGVAGVLGVISVAVGGFTGRGVLVAATCAIEVAGSVKVGRGVNVAVGPTSPPGVKVGRGVKVPVGGAISSYDGSLGGRH